MVKILMVAVGGGVGSVLRYLVQGWGQLLAPCMVVGSWLGKRLLDRISERFFVAVIDIVMVAAGVLLIAGD